MAKEKRILTILKNSLFCWVNVCGGLAEKVKKRVVFRPAERIECREDKKEALLSVNLRLLSRILDTCSPWAP